MNHNTNTVVLVMRSGGDYTMADVFLLAHHLEKTWKGTSPLKILCLNDKLNFEVVFKEITFIPFENSTWEGWWAKMNIFSPKMQKYAPFLYMDLDTAVIGSVDFFTNPENNQSKFITMGAFTGVPGKELQSGLMYIPSENDKVNFLWETWITNPQYHMRKYRGDQEFIKGVIGEPEVYWQTITDTIADFKPSNGKSIESTDSPFPLTVLADLPKEKNIICFHGYPRIKVATKLGIGWVIQYVNSYNKEKYIIRESWVINLQERTDKLKKFKSQYIPFPVQVFTAIKKPDGEAGCKASHLEILKKDHTYPFIIFEDDCKIISDWDLLKKAMSQLPDNWDMLFLGANLQHPIKKYSENLFVLTGAWAAHAVIYNTQRVVYYIIENEKRFPALDMMYHDEVQNKFNCFVVSPMMATQEPGFSDIRKAHRDYVSELQISFDKFTKE